MRNDDARCKRRERFEAIELRPVGKPALLGQSVDLRARRMIVVGLCAAAGKFRIARGDVGNNAATRIIQYARVMG